ncbi:MAG TPA: DUF4166 domain-containing protein, partial [Ktedonobacteraceae bacterium]|nr:DUF4166 domain-containing protein [Ktedonobacteraceae bacterium]
SCAVQARSPFFPVLASVEACLPEALHDQYLLRPTDNYRVILEGAMDRIWHRPFWLWPFFRLLAVFDILFPEQGKNITASMIVEGLYDKQKGASQTWHRAFMFRKTRRFDALMAFDVRHARMIEHVRPGILEIVWRVSFAAPATISIVTESIRLCIGKWRMALPRWASVEVQVKETALEETGNLISVELVMRQSWLGEIFGYHGRFHVRREQKKEA